MLVEIPDADRDPDPRYRNALGPGNSEWVYRKVRSRHEVEDEKAVFVLYVHGVCLRGAGGGSFW